MVSARLSVVSAGLSQRLEERFRLGTSYLVVSARLSVVLAGLSAAGRKFRLGTSPGGVS